MDAKTAVHDFWNAAVCGEVYGTGATRAEQYANQLRERYRLEPYILQFARFGDGLDRDVLEIGVGMGADHTQWAASGPNSLTGVDLTEAAVERTTERLAIAGGSSDLRVADAEQLPFADTSFDIVYSWGVLHHSPNTQSAVDEVRRVLRPDGTARVMIYHRPSIVGALLWFRYGLLAGKPQRPMRDIYATHLESPGTKAYTIAEAREMFRGFSHVHAEARVGFGDLLEGEVGQRHRSFPLRVAKRLWPRWLVRRMNRFGLLLLVEAVK